jgi:hypothetical protein
MKYEFLQPIGGVRAFDWKRVVLTLLVFLTLLVSFKANIFRIAKQDRFLRFHAGAQTLIEAKLADGAAGKGIWDGGGLLFNRPLFFDKVENADPGLSGRYNSQFGLQGYLARLMQSCTGLGVDRMMRGLEWLVSGALALLFSIFYHHLSKKFGLIAALPGVLLVLFSIHLLIMARNVYWIPFALFLPSVVAAMLLPAAWDDRRIMIVTGLLFFASILFKCLCGYEFVTNLVLSASPALLFYGLICRDSWKKQLVRQSAFFVIGVAAFAVALAIHLITLSVSLGSPQESWAAVADRASHNTYAGDVLAEREYALKYLKPYVGLPLLIAKLLSFDAMNIGVYPNFGEGNYHAARFTYWGLLAIGACLCIPGWVALVQGGLRNFQMNEWVAVSLSLPWAFVCSVSWVVAARGHSIEQMELGVIYFLFPFMVHLWFCMAVIIWKILGRFAKSCSVIVTA